MITWTHCSAPNLTVTLETLTDLLRSPLQRLCPVSLLGCWFKVHTSAHRTVTTAYMCYCKPNSYKSREAGRPQRVSGIASVSKCRGSEDEPPGAVNSSVRELVKSRRCAVGLGACCEGRKPSLCRVKLQPALN